MTRENRPYTIEALARHILEDGGATFRYVGRGDVHHVDGSDGRTWVIGVRSLSITPLPGELARNLDTIAHVLRTHLRNRRIGIGFDYGAWIDEGKVYVDLVTRRESRSLAERIGRDHDQLAIFNLATGETITL